MAKRNRPENPTAADMKAAFGADIKFRTYKNDGAGFDEFDENQEIVGVLVSIRDHTITDNRTNLPKDIRVYSIRIALEGGGERVIKIGGRSILDRLFDDIMDENGGYAVDNKRYTGQGYEYIRNRLIKMSRGDDSQTAKGNPLGTYEIAVEEK